MKFKFFIITQVLFLFYLKPNNQKDPFSEIKITSKRAICQKDKNNKSIFDFTYIDDVTVNFADGSSAQSEKLSIKINSNPAKHLALDKNPEFFKEADERDSQPHSNLGNIKQITLNKNVFLKRENRNIKADKAEIYPTTKICKLSGNIRIEQIKKNQKDFPIITECQNAQFDLVTEQISFIGDKNNPVSTIIKLEGHPGLLKKKKTKIKK